jgi:hypothetical protein
MYGWVGPLRREREDDPGILAHGGGQARGRWPYV